MNAAGETPFRLVPLGKEHDRQNFTCRVESLDSYLKTQAGQDMRRKANAVCVLVTEERPEEVAGYFTLCATSLAPGGIPETARRHLPRYPLVSATLLGRLAVAREWQGRGIGSRLLTMALEKSLQNAGIVGSSMVVVDALDERAARFYGQHGFIRLRSSMRLVMPMRTIAKLIGG
ncbi:MAG: GNAT family N-acetyltransferase [Terracidiphilus sp.]